VSEHFWQVGHDSGLWHEVQTGEGTGGKKAERKGTGQQIYNLRKNLAESQTGATGNREGIKNYRGRATIREKAIISEVPADLPMSKRKKGTQEEDTR